LKLLLNADKRYQVVGEAEDGIQALAFIEKNRPALAILDVALPKMNGIDVVRSVVSRNISTKCIMLTMHEEPEIALSALHAGAKGYILKGNTFDDLNTAVTAVLENKMFMSPEIAAAVEQTTVRRADQDATLTGREHEILMLIAQGQANKEIADKLSISIRTVEAHRSRIMRKTGMRSHAALIHYAAKKTTSSVE